MKIINVVGARPNFMKMAPVHSACLEAGLDAKLIHTGQHYDENMSKVFFDELGMPKPDENLTVGSGSHAVQTATIMTSFEQVLLRDRPDAVMVAGDINSTIACALVATKMHIPVAHLEAGLRSGDRRMPEEINRILTDRISECLLTPSPDGDENLLAEGTPKEWIYRVGNAMIDSLVKHKEVALQRPIHDQLNIECGNYALVTMHRPGNVDDADSLKAHLQVLAELSARLTVLFPVHPRTRKRIDDLGYGDLVSGAKDFRLIEPQGYLDFLALQAGAKMVVTDSGGIQEETTALGIPCLTVRPNTERPVTITEGTNTLVGTDPDAIRRAAYDVLDNGGKAGRIPELWDGQTGPRVVEALGKAFG